MENTKQKGEQATVGIPSININALRYTIYIKKQIFLYIDSINLFGTLKCKIIAQEYSL